MKFRISISVLFVAALVTCAPANTPRPREARHQVAARSGGQWGRR